MLIIFLIVFSVILLLCIRWLKKSYGRNGYSYDSYKEGAVAATVAFSIIIGAILFVALGLGIAIINGRVVEDKIQMYQEENDYIQNEVHIIIENYKEFEKSTYSEFKNESLIVLISLFPELKTNELVNRQIDIYVSNNTIIRELREKQINLRVQKWWLYFGR